MRIRSRAASLATALGLAASVQVLHAQEPGDIAVRKAVDDVVARLANKPPRPVVVREVVGCYPGAGDDKGRFLCLVNMNGPDGTFSVQPLALERRGAADWQALPPSSVPTPSCPSRAVAEPLFQQRMGAAAKVTDAPDEEDGLFTDERGMARDKKGPMRLMCTYGVTRNGNESTVVAYFTYKSGKYGLDADYETWH